MMPYNITWSQIVNPINLLNANLFAKVATRITIYIHFKGFN